MKTPAIILFVSLACFVLNSCKIHGHDNVDPTPGAPVVTVVTSPLTILIPNNCSQSFIISNTGPNGSTLNFTVADDGAPGGFLSFTPSSGSLAAGASAQINVEVKTAFVNASPSLAGASLVLNVYTPQASNYQKVPVPVNVKSVFTEAPLLIGTWAGKWSGKSSGGRAPGDSAVAVSGTWSLTIATADTASKTITGSLTWKGNDAYWAPVLNSLGVYVSETLTPFAVNTVVPLNASNTSFYINAGPPGGCSSNWINLQIKSAKVNYNTNSYNYGPSFGADFDITNNTIAPVYSWFTTQTSTASTSTGTITGAKL